MKDDSSVLESEEKKSKKKKSKKEKLKDKLFKIFNNH
jgi:hypothetical protein